MSGNYTFKNKTLQWIDKRLPLVSLTYHTLYDYPTPKNLNYWWNFGSLSLFFLLVMLGTGLFLAMHYQAGLDPNLGFASFDLIMRDVGGGLYGQLMRNMHANGASFFFIVVYIHIFRGLYFGSYKAPREILWIIGVVILLLMMAAAFMGYSLVGGQMSMWGATVITNFFNGIPFIGSEIVETLRGSFAIDNPTIKRFFVFHYLIPFLLVGVIILHVWALHAVRSNNPLGIEIKTEKDAMPFHPYYTFKDIFGIAVAMVFFLLLIFFGPDLLGHADNYTEANPLVTPAHIVPEWYFLPFYAILRASTQDIFGGQAALIGVLLMFAAIAILLFVPWLDGAKVRSNRFKPLSRFFFWLLLLDVLFLGWVGGKGAEQPYIFMTQFATFWYFLHFLVILPLVSRLEKHKPLPSSIHEAVLSAQQQKQSAE